MLSVVLAYFAGVISVWVVLWFVATRNPALSFQDKTPEPPPEEYPQVAQFVDPEPLSEKLKEGTELKEIIQ